MITFMTYLIFMHAFFLTNKNLLRSIDDEKGDGARLEPSKYNIIIIIIHNNKSNLFKI